MSNSEDGFQWEVIHTYSRKQALEDGSLIDVTEFAQLHGFKIPCAITASLWVYIGISPELSETGQPVAGRNWFGHVVGRRQRRRSNLLGHAAQAASGRPDAWALRNWRYSAASQIFCGDKRATLPKTR